jgi:hypothetical protein
MQRVWRARNAASLPGSRTCGWETIYGLGGNDTTSDGGDD